MVFPLGVSAPQRIPTASFWSGGAASLLVIDRAHVRHLGTYPMARPPGTPRQSITCFQRFRVGGDPLSNLFDPTGLGYRGRWSERRIGCCAQQRADLRILDFGCGRGGDYFSVLALRASLVPAHRGGAAPGGAPWFRGSFLSAGRGDFSSFGDDRDQ